MSGKMNDIAFLLRDESKSLADLDWLVIDPEEYRKIDKLPRQNLDAIPELEEQWKYLSEKDRYRLSPENREPSRPNTPFWSEREIANDLGDPEKIELVETFFRKSLQEGLPVKEAISRLRGSFDAETLGKASSRIKEASKEAGLLGVVYIDASLYPGWDRKKTADIQKEIGPSGRQAYFVVADAYQHVDEFGRCSKFQKEIVFDVNDIHYDEELWEHYRTRYEAAGKDLSDISEGLSPREKIRQAFYAPYREERIDTGPKLKERQALKITASEALERLDKFAATWQQEVVENVYRKNKIRKVAIAMMRGEHGPQIRDMVENDPDLAVLKPQIHLLGNLYADLSYFENGEEAFSALRDRQIPIVVGEPRSKVKKAKLGEIKALAYKPAFHISMPEAVNQIVHRYALSKFGYGYEKRVGKRLKKLADTFMEMPVKELRSLAQGIYSKPLPKEVREYEHLAPVIINLTKGVSREEAFEELGKYKPQRQKVRNTYGEDLKRELVIRMMLGDHSEGMRARIELEGFRDLEKHLHLLGNVYIKVFPFAGQDVIEAVKEQKPSLKNLPLIKGEGELEEVFRDKGVRTEILHKYACLQGGGTEQRKKIASVITDLDKMRAEEIREFAQMVYALDATKVVRERDYEHLAPVIIDPTKGIDKEEAFKVFGKYKPQRETVLSKYREEFEKKLASQMIRGDHTASIQARIQAGGFKRLANHIHLMGRLYVPSTYFNQEELRKIAKEVEGLDQVPLVSEEEMEAFFSKATTKGAILKQYTKIRGADKKKLSSLMESLKDMSPSEVWKVAKMIYSAPEASSVNVYKAFGQRGKVVIGVSLKEAVEALDRAERQQGEKPGLLQSDKNTLLKVAHKMLAGDHGPAIQAMIHADPLLEPLKPHIHLLGRLYTASYLFTGPREYAIFQNYHEHLKDLPDIGENPRAFFQRSSTIEKIVRRASLVANMSGERRSSYERRFRTKLKSKTAEQVMRAASIVYSQEIPKEEEVYSGHEQTAHYIEGPGKKAPKVEEKVGEMLESARHLLRKGHKPETLKRSLQKIYGKPVVKAGSLYIEELVDKASNPIESFVAKETLEAASGLEQMAAMELGEGQINNPLEDIDIEEERELQPLSNFTFDGMVLGED